MSQWEWGKVHTLTLKHPLGSVKILDRIFSLNRGPFSVGGSYHTVSPYSYPLTDLFHANHGSSHRHIYVPGDWDRSQVIFHRYIWYTCQSFLLQSDRKLSQVHI